LPISDVLVIKDERHHPAIVIEQGEIPVLERASKPESAANQRWRRDRIDVVVDGPDEVILRQLYGLAIRIEPLQLAQQLVQLTLATEVIEKNESASVQVFLEVDSSSSSIDQ